METKVRSMQDSFLETLRSEIVAGTEILSDWVSHVEANGGVEVLFEFEMWLRGLSAFFDRRHLPLAAGEQGEWFKRSFSPEIRTARLALQECERCAIALSGLGQNAKVEFEALVETQVYQANMLDSQIGRLLEQATPLDSVARLLESINDLKVMMGAAKETRNQDFQLFLSFGRTLQGHVRECRYIDMLLGQRFRLQYDRIDNSVMSGVLRAIPEDHVRHNVALALLYLHRFLRYLKPVESALAADQPLRRFLVVFALLHEQSETLCDFLKSRFLRERRGPSQLQRAADPMIQMLEKEPGRVMQQELTGLAAEKDAGEVFTRVQAAHRLLRNCYQGCVVTLVQAMDPAVEARALFPGITPAARHSQKLRREVCDLRQDLKRELEITGGIRLDRVLERLTEFREQTFANLVYHDWGRFERFSESLIAAAGPKAMHDLLLGFLSFLDNLAEDGAARDQV